VSVQSYGQLCTEVYNFTKPVGKSIGGDIEFYMDRLRSCQRRILEPMAGSGRMLIPLLQAGLTVDGVDSSPEMLASCRKDCVERGLQVNLMEAMLQDLALPHRYEAIVIPAGSFLLIENREQSIAVLKRLYDHLAPGGRLIMDLLMPDILNMEKGKVSVSTFELPDGDVITMESTLIEADLFRQYYASYLKYTKWRNGQMVQCELQRLALRWYGIEEFRMLLADIGFEDIVLSADYEFGRTPDCNKQVFTFEATRK